MQFEGYAYVWSELLLTLQSMLLMQATSFAKVIIQSHRASKHYSEGITIVLWFFVVSFFFPLCEIKHHTWISFHKYHTQSTYETNNGGLLALTCRIKLHNQIRVIKQIWLYQCCTHMLGTRGWPLLACTSQSGN